MVKPNVDSNGCLQLFTREGFMCMSINMLKQL